MSSAVVSKGISAVQEGLSHIGLSEKQQVLTVTSEDKKESSYPEYLPIWDKTIPQQPAYTKVPYDDRALYADTSLPTLLPTLKLASKEISLKEISPKFGTVVTGVQLTDLVDNPKAKDELASLIAQRGVLVFHNQENFFKLGPDKLKEFISYYGVPHEHPTSGNLKGHPEFHNIYKSGTFNPERLYGLTSRTTSTAWHSDVTYEEQPPSYSLIAMVNTPPSGGDTIFADTREAYNRLSDGFKERLHGLKASHSAHEQAAFALKAGGVVRRAPVINYHPIVRQHPVTKRKSIYVNHQFTREIEGYKREESSALLDFLYLHVGTSVDYQIRVNWKQFSVVFWDNRIAIHSAILDFDPKGHTRHAFRLMVRGEVPVEGDLDEAE
ncbi:hypothetical protein BABINDRAFT_166809 [Babjeviella inositovora NRRL Y-12698]|uniref:TauD/TfdA-like domain-containing protein n=1 Tax=Babjeviella inositovora NRRL Y-12698 TaxID=984486 RepID=A0A1E3QPQ8_9ASCO|nr:uncharacterized protein BABINDRAFT_166809 [Babjeviella inositovora NRRL Y-12698]ODQ79693.1 hypothetical protein BABINDRAFT_166809 [Babjeviella inositovora NRRL Y-12698]